jgi:hypothetical protein
MADPFRSTPDIWSGCDRQRWPFSCERKLVRTSMSPYAQRCHRHVALVSKLIVEEDSR